MRRCALALVVLVGCGDNAVAPDAVPAAPRPQGSPASGPLVINEISPRGPGPDWIELLNRSDVPIDLCGVFLTDAMDRLDHYLPLGGVMAPAPCPPRLIAPGEYLVVRADDTLIIEAGPIDPAHAPFELSIADEVHLVSLDGAALDGLLYLYPPGPEGSADVTLARGPDGDGPFWTMWPTPGAVNGEPPP